MKKFIKTLITFLLIIACSYFIYHYRYEIIDFIVNIKIGLENYFDEGSNQIYTDEEIQEMLKESQVEIEGEYTGKLDNYYYEQLDIYGKVIYKTLLDNIDELKIGTYEIKLSNVLSNAMKEDDGKEIINLAFQNAWNAFRLDHPEVYYINVTNMYLTTKSITLGKNVTYEFYLNNREEKSLQPEFYTIDAINNSSSEISKKKEEIIKDIKDSSSFAKILYIHNWIVDNIEYDINMQNANNSNIYGAIIENKVVCEGYAKAFKYLLDELNIPCVIVCGDVTDENGNTQSHAWNAVYLDGKWYAVDITWDDPIIIGEGKLSNDLKYKYFLKGTAEIEKNHKETGRLSDNAKEIEFKYPELSLQDYKK